MSFKALRLTFLFLTGFALGLLCLGSARGGADREGWSSYEIREVISLLREIRDNTRNR